MIRTVRRSLCKRTVDLVQVIDHQRFRSNNAVTNSPTKPSSSDLRYGDGLFNYTRGRFICDEEREMSDRHVHFNVGELARLTAESVGARSCLSILKYPDGMYNKSMLLTMDNGAEVVAKIPNPNAGLPHFTTASEVATMDFARTVLQTPVPKALQWNSHASESPIGAEYIIMEKAPGIELERVWSNLTIKDRLSLVKNIASMQQVWSSVAFKHFGSLYYEKDLAGSSAAEAVSVNDNGRESKNERFAIGPSTGREWFDNGRSAVEIDRGPWHSLEKYHASIGSREIACVTQLPHLPKSPVSLHGPGTYQPTREKKLKALDAYMQLYRYLLPLDEAISSSHLWHNDLHVANIFVDPQNPKVIVSIIDWQSAELAPLYFQARQPHLMDYDGPILSGLERPSLPENMDQLSSKAQKDAERLYLQQSLCSLYRTFTYHTNKRLYSAFEFQETSSYLLLLLARNLLIDGEPSFLSQAVELESAWSHLPRASRSPYPFSFIEGEKKQWDVDVEGSRRGMEAMRLVRDRLGHLFPEQGLVRADQYEKTLEALSQIRDQLVHTFAKTDEERDTWLRHWPFGT